MARPGQRSWWVESHGGAPGWAIVAALLLGVAVGVLWAVTSSQPPQSAAQPSSQSTSAESTPEPTTAAPVVLFLGDSYTAGARASFESARWANLVATARGWELQNLARGGTGFANGLDGEIAQIGCGLDHCGSFTEMAAEGASIAPDIVIVSGGRNDATQPIEQSGPGITAFFDTIAATYPDAKIYATNSLWDASVPPETIVQMTTVIQAEVTRIGGTYLDIGQPLGGRPDLVANDGVHPNDQGHAAIADAFLAAAG